MQKKEPNNQNASTKQRPENVPACPEKKHHRSLWMLFLVFFVFVAIIFLTKHRDTIDWVEDYEGGIKLAKQQNKPILLTFYKQHTRFCSEMSQNTYSNPVVIEYVETTFVPILIDVDKQPEIAKRYNIDYYPTHYIKPPDSDELIGPHVGDDSPQAFIQKLKELHKKMDQTIK